MTVFDQNWLLGRNPRGGIEDLHQMKAANFKGLAVNVGDHEEWEWAAIRERARAVGMWCGPWLHTRGSDGMFDVRKLERLVAIAKAWDSPVVVNSEKEIDGSGAICTTLIAAAVKGMDACVSTEAWLFNPPSVDWTPLAHVPFALQIFPESGATDGYPFKVHAHECGIECVYYTFASYGGRGPADYRLHSPYSVYTADDIGQDNYVAWMPTAVSGVPACIDQEEKPMPYGAAQSAREAYQLFGGASSLNAWRRDNPGEWNKLQAYWAAAPGEAPPTGITSDTGKAHLALIEARRWAEGSHA